jgi:hypothetical protein
MPGVCHSVRRAESRKFSRLGKVLEKPRKVSRVRQIPIAHPLDADGDGKSNLDEYRDGTDPELP